MRIGQLSALTGLSRDALRFYEKRGLLTSQRHDNGYRSYPPEAAQWLRYIRTAQSLGFTLSEIEADLPLMAAGPDVSAVQLRTSLQHKVDEISRRIDGLLALRAELTARLDETMAACPLRPAAS